MLIASRTEIVLEGSPLAVASAMQEFAVSNEIVIRKDTTAADLLRYYLVKPDPNKILHCGTFDLVALPKSQTLFVLDPRPHHNHHRQPTQAETEYYSGVVAQLLLRFDALGFVDLANAENPKPPLGFPLPGRNPE